MHEVADGDEMQPARDKASHSRQSEETWRRRDRVSESKWREAEKRNKESKGEKSRSKRTEESKRKQMRGEWIK
jgi:hypothetical protein